MIIILCKLLEIVAVDPGGTLLFHKTLFLTFMLYALHLLC
jgi:hypothetical protein